MYMCFMGNGYVYEVAQTPHNLSCVFETLTKRLDCIKGLLKFDMAKWEFLLVKFCG